MVPDSSPFVLGNFGCNWQDLKPAVFLKSSERMEVLTGESVNLVVTSPPYGSIKDYGVDGQIGFLDSFDEYFQRLCNVWGECHRVLRAGSRLVINVGDQFLRKKDHGRYRVVPIAARIIQDCLSIGFDYLGDVIWQKISTTNTTGGCSLMGSLFYPRNGLLTFDYEHILIFKKVQGVRAKIDPYFRECSKIPLDEWKKWYTGHWRFPGVVQKEHIAMFPETLPHRIIRMFSAIGDTVLDPFCGSGTTLKVAWSLLRKSIGFEVNSAFEPIITAKIQEATPQAFTDYQFCLNLLLSKSQWTIDLNFSRQKGITCLVSPKGTHRAVIDFLILDSGDINSFQQGIQRKIGENPFQNYLAGRGNWADIGHFILFAPHEGYFSNTGLQVLKPASVLTLKQLIELPLGELEKYLCGTMQDHLLWEKYEQGKTPLGKKHQDSSLAPYLRKKDEK